MLSLPGPSKMIQATPLVMCRRGLASESTIVLFKLLNAQQPFGGWAYTSAGKVSLRGYSRKGRRAAARRIGTFVESEACPPPFTQTKSAPKERFCNIQLRSEEHTSELQSQSNLVCRLL